MSSLFQGFKVGNVHFKNRFVMSAAADNLTENIFEERMKWFSELAEGGIGLIITGALKASEMVKFKWSDIIRAVHEKGGRIAMEIIPDVGYYFRQGVDNIAVSVLDEKSPFFTSTPFTKYAPHREASDDEIRNQIDSYGKAAALAREYGADALEIHSAHQSVAMSFLSPLTNRRTDKWGGSLENRTRFIAEIYKSVRKAAGEGFPVIIKLGVEDFIPGGLKFDEGKEISKIAASIGYDIIEVSQGLMNLSNMEETPMRMKIRNRSDEAYFRNWTKEIRKLTGRPVILQGGIRSFEVAEDIINSGDADFVGMCRPFACEPGLVKRWENGDRRKSRCTSCNKCILERTVKGKSWRCVFNAV